MQSSLWRLCRRLEQLLKRYNRGEIAPVEWLDHLTLSRIQHQRAQVSFTQCANMISRWTVSAACRAHQHLSCMLEEWERHKIPAVLVSIFRDLPLLKFIKLKMKAFKGLMMCTADPVTI